MDNKYQTGKSLRSLLICCEHVCVCVCLCIPHMHVYACGNLETNTEYETYIYIYYVRDFSIIMANS